MAPESPQNQHRRLSYRLSPSLETGSEARELYSTPPSERHIDGVLACDDNRRCYYLGFKTGVTIQQFSAASSRNLADGKLPDEAR